MSTCCPRLICFSDLATHVRATDAGRPSSALLLALLLTACLLFVLVCPAAAFSLDTYTQVADLQLLADTVGVRPDDAEGPGMSYACWCAKCARLSGSLTALFLLSPLFECVNATPSCASDFDALFSGEPCEEEPSFMARFRKLNRAIVDVLDDYSMVGFRALDIQVSALVVGGGHSITCEAFYLCDCVHMACGTLRMTGQGQCSVPPQGNRQGEWLRDWVPRRACT